MKPFTAVWQNIMGTPPMSYKKVKADLERIKRENNARVWNLQEMKWPWYWLALNRVFPKKEYGRHPKKYRSRGRDQVQIWDRDRFRKIEARTTKLHNGRRKMTETRYINEVLLEDKDAGTEDEQRYWFRNTHYLPGAWSKTRTQIPLRRDIWLSANEIDRAGLYDCAQDGFPVVGGGDYNRMDNMVVGSTVQNRQIRYYGKKGLDYIYVVNGAKGEKIDVIDHGRIPHGQLNTDHPGRVIDVKDRA